VENNSCEDYDKDNRSESSVESLQDSGDDYDSDEKDKSTDLNVRPRAIQFDIPIRQSRNDSEDEFLWDINRNIRKVQFQSLDKLAIFTAKLKAVIYKSAIAIYTTEPAFVKEALAGPDAYKWLKAFDNEILNHLHCGTFEFIDRREVRASQLVTTKWVIKAKQASDGNISKFKVRLVACRFTQQKGIDYFQTYASTARAAL
jgi:hypothetical protein